MTGVDHLFDALSGAEAIDLTHPLKPGIPVWPGHPCFCQTPGEQQERGDASTWNALALGEHSGTHFDAPLHFFRGGASIAATPPVRFFGPMATISCLGIAPSAQLGPAAIEAWETDHGRIRRDDAVFFHFGWDRFWDTDPAAFLANWPGLSGDAAALLVSRGARIVGTDCLSIDSFVCDHFPAHHALLGAGLLIGENFARLGDLPPRCALAALPLPIVEGSGSPLRAIAFVERSR